MLFLNSYSINPLQASSAQLGFTVQKRSLSLSNTQLHPQLSGSVLSANLLTTGAAAGFAF